MLNPLVQKMATRRLEFKDYVHGNINLGPSVFLFKINVKISE